MRKLDKKAKKGGKARKPKRQAERVLGRKEDFAPTGI